MKRNEFIKKNYLYTKYNESREHKNHAQFRKLFTYITIAHNHTLFTFYVVNRSKNILVGEAQVIAITTDST